MEKLDFSKKLKVHFIGIGGISMSAIAFILHKNGFTVVGSDFSENDEVKKLKKLGINVTLGHKADSITSDIDVVVYSKAIHVDNPEIVEAKKKGIKLMSRSKMLGLIMANYDKRICIAGTHGKTTTTALISKAMLDQNMNPTINVGGTVDELGGNTHIGSDEKMFIAEACEYTNSFLDFCPNTAVVTNIEEDHLDFFKDLDDIRKSFKKYIELLPNGSNLIINNRIPNIDELVKDTKLNVITYGEDKSANYYFDNVKYDDKHYMSFDVYHDGKLVGNMKQRLIGRHNALNFLAAYATVATFGVSFDDVKKSLKNFKGARRRLELKAVINGITFIDDYAHHPTEIEASINALKELNHSKLYLIFQPHTFTRTKSLYKEFVKVLGQNDNVILAKIYPAREKDLGIISSNDVKKGIIEDKTNKNNFCEYFDTFEKISEFIVNEAKKGDIVVTMGAGDVYKVFDEIKSIFQNKNNLYELSSFL